MKKFIIGFFISLLVLAGLAWLLYPTAANQVALYKDDTVIRAYQRRVRNMTRDQIQDRFTKAADYNHALESLRIGELFSDKPTATSHRYEAPLNIGDDLVGVLTLPGIAVTLPVYHESAAHSASGFLVHAQGSSLPADEPGSHVVLAGPGLQKAQGFAGRLNLTGARMLQNADRLIPGDLLVLSVLDRTLCYEVQWIQTMTPEGLAEFDLAPGPEDDWLTLIAEKEDRRLMIRGSRIAATEAAARLQKRDQASPLPHWQSILLLGSPVILLGLLVMFVIERIKIRSYRLPMSWNDDEETGEDASHNETRENDDE